MPTHITTSVPSLRVLGRYDEALVSLDRALLLRPDYVKALNNRGAVLEGINRLPEALACYDRALALAPASPSRGTIAAACCSRLIAPTMRSTISPPR